MRICWLLLVAGGLAVANLCAASIQYDVADVGVSPLGDPIFRYTYFVTDLTLSSNQEVDIRFDPALFGSLFNAVAGSDFDVLLFQPNDPLGSEGVFSALALVNNPSFAVPFRVDATFIGPRGGIPGAQLFSINEFDASGNFRVIETGSTTLSPVPEPGTFSYSSMLLALGCGWWAMRRRSKPAR